MNSGSLKQNRSQVKGMMNIVPKNMTALQYMTITLNPCSGKGLVYYGITLIPPSSLPEFKKIIDLTGLTELQVLSKKIDEAMKRNKFMIHYGI